MRFLYTLTFFLLTPFLVARLLWRSLAEPAHRDRWYQRFALGLPPAPDKRPIWIHAVSLGEAIAASPLVKHLQLQHPNLPILVTTTTYTGAETARRRFGVSIVQCYFPYDLNILVARFLHHFQPRLVIVMETELWPNLFAACKTRAIPVLIANGRLSRRSYERYRWVRGLSRSMLAAAQGIAAQSDDDARRFIKLGADPAVVEITGSLKFDVELPASTLESGQVRRRHLGTSRAVLMAGSTRENEEEILLQMVLELRQREPTLLLVIAPRHPQRFEQVMRLCQSQGLAVSRHSRGDPCPPEVTVYLLDTIGELPSYYAASDVAFVGGSLVPAGGHNVLEPAALGIPVVVGPHTDNFADIVLLLKNAGALQIAADPPSLISIVADWLHDSAARDTAGRCGQEIVQQNHGATAKIVMMVEKLLQKSANNHCA